MSVTQLGYLGVSVSDMDAWETYAQEVLGMELMERSDDGTTYLRMDEYHHRIGLYPTGADDVIHVGFQTANRKSLEKIKTDLLSIGVEYQPGTPEEIANRHVVDMIKVDLSGAPVEVFYGPHVLFEQPFHSPIAHNGFKTGTNGRMGLGHLGMNVDDMDEAARILEEGLGFLVSDNLGGQDRFFHCNPREHTAVLGPIEQRGPKRIGHFMIENNDFNDVGRGMQRCEQQDVKLTTGLQRHTNDHMVSFYMVNPSGFGIEYGWGGREIDDETWTVQQYRVASQWKTTPPGSTAAKRS
jgi:2,3-dihydroxybiphenyl 1,2-dioxygenase